MSISIEVDISVGLFNFKIVGLADKSIDEAKDRIHAALKNNKYRSPKSSNRKTTISLAPAEIRKSGSHFDVAIAIAYLIASKQIKKPKRKTLILGELSFDGSVHSTKGIFSMVTQLQSEGIERIYIPRNTKNNLLRSLSIEIVECDNIQEIITSLNKEVIPQTKTHEQATGNQKEYTYDSIQGNEEAKRALFIALCGGHNISLCGIPGTGKTLLAKAASELMPTLSIEKEIETQSIYSLSNTQKEIGSAPFRNPHHHSSVRTIFGGGNIFTPGEILLSHHGILFLDEFPEFNRAVIEGLREILQDKRVRISRNHYSVDIPINIMLIISHNPCPCGHHTSSSRICTCSPHSIQKYNNKLSGPIMDRIDMRLFLEKISYEKFMQKNATTKQHDTATHISLEIQKTRELQYKKRKCLNGDLTNRAIQALLITDDARSFLNQKAHDLHISARGYYSLLKVAQTIADIENKNKIERQHILEALYFRVTSEI